MNFLEAQKVLLKILKLLGFFTYAVEADVVRNRVHYVHCVVMSGVIQGLFVWSHLNFQEKVGNYLQDGNRASNFFTNIEGYCVVLCYLIVYYSVFVQSSTQIEFIKTLLRIEREIGALKFSRSTYNERLRKTTFLDVFSTALGSILVIFFYIFVTVEKHYVAFLIATWSFLSMIVYLNLFLFFIENLVKTDGNLADELSWNFQNCVTSCPFHFFSEDLRQILKLHDRLVQSIVIFNRSFGIIVLGMYSYCFLIFSFECYFAYSTFFDSSKLTPAMNIATFLTFLGNILGYVPMIFSLSKLGFVGGTAEAKVCCLFRIK